ncbi:MAG: DUF1232 domain-containing protein [Actinobacteria bacterium]|nr:DUF1232 domain-containing protein [Actinomycetota bacterium]
MSDEHPVPHRPQQPDDASASSGERPSDGRGDVQRSSAAKQLIRFLPDVGRLLYDVSRDDRVPFPAKVKSGAAAAYVFSPVDVIPDFIPGLGQMDDIAIVVWAVRNLFRSAGYDVLKDLWSGTDDGFALLLMVAGVEA